MRQPWSQKQIPEVEDPTASLSSYLNVGACEVGVITSMRCFIPSSQIENLKMTTFAVAAIQRSWTQSVAPDIDYVNANLVMVIQVLGLD